MKAFVILMIAWWPVVAYSQEPVYDTTGKSLQRQLKELSSIVDSLRIVANDRSSQRENASRQWETVLIALRKAREVTIFDPKLFFESLTYRMIFIMAGNADFMGKSIRQFNAVQESMRQALVHKPEQQKIIDSLSDQYIALDKQRLEIQKEFDDILIRLDYYISELDDVKKRMNNDR